MNDERFPGNEGTSAQLPEAIERYLASRQAHDTDAALRAFVDGATVTDEGKTYSGTDAIRDWLGRSASEYTYTVELIEAQRIDDTHHVAINRLDGNFPGVTV